MAFFFICNYWSKGQPCAACRLQQQNLFLPFPKFSSSSPSPYSCLPASRHQKAKTQQNFFDHNKRPSFLPKLFAALTVVLMANVWDPPASVILDGRVPDVIWGPVTSDAKNTDNVSMEPACVREDSMENTVPLMPVEDRVAMIMVFVKTWLRGTKIDLTMSKCN